MEIFTVSFIASLTHLIGPVLFFPITLFIIKLLIQMPFYVAEQALNYIKEEEEPHPPTTDKDKDKDSDHYALFFNQKKKQSRPENEAESLN